MFFSEKSPRQQGEYDDYNIRIVAKCPGGGQEYKVSISLIIGRKLTLEKLIRSIQAKQLTECLEILEKAGFTGDLAVFILANLQSLGGAV